MVLVLAGCAAPAAPTDAPPADEARSFDVTLEDCLVVEAQVMVPEARARPFVPDDFDLLVEDTGVRVILGGSTCALGSRAFLAIAVEPTRDTLRAEGVQRYFWEPEHDVLGDDLAAVFRAARANATNVSTIRTATPPTGATLVVEADAWRHEIALTAVFGPPLRSFAGIFREYVPAHGGYAYLDASFVLQEDDASATGASTIVTGEGTPSRALMGERTAGVAIALRSASFANATIGFVPSPDA